MPELQTSSGNSRDLWLRVGRVQALAFVGNGCYAAQAHSLKELRDSGAYKREKLTWQEFCERYVGMTNRQADRIIAQLDEFGETYFRLSELIQISPRVYRGLAEAGVIKDSCLDIGGELIPITPENGPRIKAALTTLRRDLEAAKKRQARDSFSGIDYLESQFEMWIDELSGILYRGDDGRAAIRAQVLLDRAIERLNTVKAASRPGREPAA